ncbi:hypothetical protein [Acerihabitans sp.]|uniref:hypothetical protein n=1 Tax=Acerihabitans sp. TaxID=2811394 RepID=UPI002ED8E621
MNETSYSVGFISGVIKGHRVNRYKEDNAGRSLLKHKLQKITNSPSVPAKKNRILAHAGSTTATSYSGARNLCHPADSTIIRGNAFSGGQTLLNDIHPSNTSTRSFPPKPQDIAITNPARLRHTFPINPLQPENMNLHWPIERELRSLKAQLSKDLLRNALLRELIRQTDETHAHRQQHLHAPEMTSAAPGASSPCRICGLWANYQQVLTAIKASRAPSGDFFINQHGQKHNSAPVLLALACALHHLVKKDTDILLDGIRSLPAIRATGLPESNHPAKNAASPASPEVATRRYRMLRVNPAQLEKTWRINDHISVLIIDLNRALAQNANLRRLMKTSPLTSHAVGHVHTLIVQSADVDNSPECGICVLWKDYNNFFRGLTNLTKQPGIPTVEYDVDERNLNVKVFKLTHKLLSIIKKDSDNLLDGLPHYPLTAYGSGHPEMQNLSWEKITAAMTLDPVVSIAGNDMPRIDVAQLDKLLDTPSHISRIKSEFADMLSLNFRLRQQLAQLARPGEIDMHFHTNTLKTADFNTANQCYFCWLCADYNLALNRESRPGARSDTDSRGINHRGLENNFTIFSLTHLLLTHLKKDTQTLRDRLLCYPPQ